MIGLLKSRFQAIIAVKGDQSFLIDGAKRVFRKSVGSVGLI